MNDGWERVPDDDGWEPVPPKGHGLGSVVGEKATSAFQTMTGRHGNVDYGNEVEKFGFRANFSRQDNQEERANFLNNNAGKMNWYTDKGGTYILTPKGAANIGVYTEKPIPVDKSMWTEGLSGLNIHDVADMRGDAPAIAGGVGAGMMATGVGVIPGAAMVAGGTMIGKTIDSIGDMVHGDNLQTPTEMLSDIGTEGVLAGAGDLATRGALNWIGNKVIAPEASRMTPHSRQLMKEATDFGMTPQASQVTDAPIVGRMQGMFQNIFGVDKYNNSKAILHNIKRLKSSSGTRALRGEVGESIQDAIIRSKGQFTNQANVLYKDVDNLLQGRKVFPMSSLKKQAIDILDEIPKNADGSPSVFAKPETVKFLKGIADLPDNVSASELQGIRSTLFDAGQTPDLLPGLERFHAKRMWKAATKSFDDGLDEASIYRPKPSLQDGRTIAPPGGATLVQDKAGLKGIAAIKHANKFYSDGIKAYDDALLSRITRDPSVAGSIEPEVIMDVIFKKGRAGRIRRVKNVIDKDTWSKIRRRAMEDLLGTENTPGTKGLIKRTDDPLEIIFDGRSFLNKLDDYGMDTMNEMFGGKRTTELYRFGRAIQLVSKRHKMSGGIVAANIALHPMKNLGKLGRFWVFNKFMNSKLGLRYFTEGLEAPNTRAGSLALSRAAVIMGAIVDQHTTGTGAYNLETQTEEREPPQRPNITGMSH